MSKRPSRIARTGSWLDSRLGLARVARTSLRKVFPDHWSFLLGEVALYSFVVLLLTGIYLTFFFKPSQAETVYHGSYAALDGVTMTRAYRSAVELSFDVRAGLVMRQMHHWAAIVFVAAMVVHLARVFFTGAFRRPRELNWMVGVTLLLLGIGNGFTGYSLLDDQLSGTGLRIAYSIVLSIPLIGTWITSLLFGGEFPGPDIIERFYVLHILLVPAIIIGLIGLHLVMVVHQKHTQFRGPKRHEGNVVGERIWPTYAVKASGLFFLTTGILAALGGLAQINPIWIYGPFEASEVSAASQPDWYIGWLEGALRLMPAWELRAFGFELPNPFFAGVLLPSVTFGLLYLWPFLEARRTGDRDVHHLLDRPRDKPMRTALGVATIAFYAVLFFAGGSDVLATEFHLSFNQLTWSLRVALFLVPIIAGLAAHRLCRDLAARDARPPHDPPDPPAGGDQPDAAASSDVESTPELDEPEEELEPVAWPPPASVLRSGPPSARPLPP
ncbi:MAG: Ubiquinol-cytochrome C reductase, cytochrome B subunit [uncultured Acidimicrobiales bacterium]|uniref:Cytochrome bc1 complex cytochrome b subunit n=1 Tax=uncultured Acidimicrobiales bacterium TaxID=310071 RepID=A0A6J4JJH4_9ACTN|nr:MAG: Ubiquinol-cytochrome C reductase, cytochrome B subunit [uncultured Acidimicrobiales bacterium]